MSVPYPPAKSFLGTGWSFPPTFTRSTLGVEMVSDDLDIRESLHILFSTSLGERIMVAKYGCQLQDLVFRGLTAQFITEVQSTVAQAILFWEPRIDVLNVSVKRDTAVEGLLLIYVEYVVRATNVRSNLVYPFYLKEATIPAGPG